eukprot:7382108-Prymnesium_polylepis.1
MQKRKRRKRAAGSTDEESIWAKARLAQCKQFELQQGPASRRRFAGAPPGFDLAQIAWWDEHHEKCATGCVSPFDYRFPVDPELLKQGEYEYLPLAEGGEYPDWHDRMVPKHEQEARFLFGVFMRKDHNGKMVGDRFAPLEYTNKHVLGCAAFEKAIKAEVSRVNSLKGEGVWSKAKTGFEGLPGGRYQLRRIVKGLDEAPLDPRAKAIQHVLDHDVAVGETVLIVHEGRPFQLVANELWSEGKVLTLTVPAWTAAELVNRGLGWRAEVIEQLRKLSLIHI